MCGLRGGCPLLTSKYFNYQKFIKAYNILNDINLKSSRYESPRLCRV